MKIGILGTGNVGRALAKPWAEKGHEIVFGSRNPDKALEIAESMGKNVCSSTYEEAAKWGDVVVLATPYAAAQEIVKMIGGDLSGKILIDCTNPIAAGLSGLTVGLTTSAAEEIAKMTSAKVVKSFNTMGVGVMANVQFGSETASNFICGDDDAKSVVRSLGEDIGFDVIDIGPLSNARLLEPLAMLWIYLAFKHGMGTDIAFKLLRR